MLLVYAGAGADTGIGADVNAPGAGKHDLCIS